ncbi:MAG TPA: FtsW/RodA/SpoVE family cell cycle protein, partial [Ktedonobacteraceae bacterium]|nr:FtsW/RodA/SpoVE family cell cycle protein [Ktedonobacteraceae bacterium]
MPRDSRKQPNQGRQRVGERPLSVRSPALESAERRREHREHRESAVSKTNLPRMAKRSNETRRSPGEIAGPAMPRKALPPLRGRTLTANVGGLALGWRSNKTLHRSETGPQPAVTISEEEQQKLAQLEMSLPRVAGKIDPWLLIVVLALQCVGVVMVDSASSFLAASYTGDAGYYFQRELIWVFLGIIAMLVTMRIDYRFWRRISLAGMLVILPLLVIVLLIGVNVYGASRWLT